MFIGASSILTCRSCLESQRNWIEQILRKELSIPRTVTCDKTVSHKMKDFNVVCGLEKIIGQVYLRFK